IAACGAKPSEPFVQWLVVEEAGRWTRGNLQSPEGSSKVRQAISHDECVSNEGVHTTANTEQVHRQREFNSVPRLPPTKLSATFGEELRQFAQGNWHRPDWKP